MKSKKQIQKISMSQEFTQVTLQSTERLRNKCRQLDDLGIDYDITPGVPAFVAAAAELKKELTIPEISQTVIVTRTAMKSSAMPIGEGLEYSCSI